MKTPEKIKKWYKSREWRHVREYIKLKYRGICNDCGERGQEVHHIVPLTLDNFDDSNIRIGEDNLVLLCRSCHMTKRSDNNFVRGDLMIDSNGNLVPRSYNPPLSKFKSQQ